MDEPTAPLTSVEADQLHQIIWGLRDQGTTILYISHFLSEVLKIADTVTVMRDGQVMSTRSTSEETEASLVRGMLGRSLELNFPEQRPCDPTAPPVLQVRDLSAEGRFADVSFDLRPGEIVGGSGTDRQRSNGVASCDLRRRSGRQRGHRPWPRNDRRTLAT
jgi:ABC-type sugar transport system ATPase subunit